MKVVPFKGINMKQTMEIRKLGSQGATTSALGLGCMGMSDFYGTKSSRNDQESLATIKQAIDMGTSFIDTGDFYGLGHNELLIRDAIKGQRDKVFLSVKTGILRDANGGFAGIDARPQAIKNFCAYSLQRLGVDHIDLYQPARVDPAVPIEDTIGAIADLIKDGKVRYLGVSEMNAAQLRQAHAVHPVTALQIEYSLATRVIENEILPVARELGVGVVAYAPLSRGLLSGNLGGDFAPTDFRAHSPRFTGENLSKNQERVALIQKIASAKQTTAAQVAIAWVLAKGHDIVPIVGTTKTSRLTENWGALDLKLNAAEMSELDNAFSADAIAGTRYASYLMGSVAN
jgi:aryl-alcohol dehydrogenase-like predicted oxidoreductase